MAKFIIYNILPAPPPPPLKKKMSKLEEVWNFVAHLNIGNEKLKLYNMKAQSLDHGQEY